MSDISTSTAGVYAAEVEAARVLMRMAHGGILPARLKRTDPRHKTPVAAILLCAALMLAGTASMAAFGFTGSKIYDLSGSLAVFGFLTIYALVAIALPFARRAVGQHSQTVAAVSIFTALIMAMVAAHSRIPFIYLAYIVAGLAWYGLRRKHAAAIA